VLAYRYQCFGAAKCCHLGLPQRRMRYAPLGSHKSNPASVPWGIMDSYSILPWVTWEVITSVVGYPDGGYYNTRWLTGLWSTKARVENIELKDAWHWGRDSNVVNDLLEEPVCTHCMLALCLLGVSVDGDLIFFLYVCRRAPF